MNVTAFLPWLKGLGLLCLFAFGMRVQAWRDDASAAATLTTEIKAVAHENAHTESHTLAAATHIQAIAAGAQTLHNRIAVAELKAAATRGGPVHATFGPSPAAACPDPWSSDEFRVLYDAGSSAEAGEADHVLPPSP